MASSVRSRATHSDDESVEEVPLTANFRPPVPCQNFDGLFSLKSPNLNTKIFGKSLQKISFGNLLDSWILLIINLVPTSILINCHPCWCYFEAFNMARLLSSSNLTPTRPPSMLPPQSAAKTKSAPSAGAEVGAEGWVERVWKPVWIILGWVFHGVSKSVLKVAVVYLMHFLGGWLRRNHLLPRKSLSRWKGLPGKPRTWIRKKMMTRQRMQSMIH